MRDFMRIARQDQKLTMRQAAEKIGVSVGYYSMLEHGQRRPSGIVAIKLSRFYNIPIEKFYEMEQLS